MNEGSGGEGGPGPPRVPGLEQEKLLDCIHCGICLSACPTYDVRRIEGESPRGRIYLIRALAEGRVELDEGVVAHLDSCLGCRACETACPSGVAYVELLTPVRDLIERNYRRPARDRRARSVLLDLLTHPRRLAALLFGGKLAQRAFGERGPTTAVARFLFGPETPSLPIPDDASPFLQKLPSFTPARGDTRASVILLAGCVMQVLFQHVNSSTIDVLAANGCEVTVPDALGCCGAFHFHNGFLDGARSRAKALIAAAERYPDRTLVTNSAGCGSTLKEYETLFHDDPEWRSRAAAVARRSRDVSEFLADLGLRPPPREVRRRVAYHDACHLAHGQGVRSQPRALLQVVSGLELVEIERSDWCCGSAGIYNFLQPEMARELQERKVQNILEAWPDAVVMGNPGCHAWIEAGLRRAGSNLPVLHTMELLAEAYCASK